MGSWRGVAACVVGVWAACAAGAGSEYRGLRSQVIWNFLDDPSKNCQANSLAKRLDVKEARIGDRACPDGSSVVPATLAGGSVMRCVRWFPTALPRADAGETCRGVDGHLVIPTHAAVEEIMLAHVRRYTNAYRWWVGLRLVGNETDGRPKVAQDRPDASMTYWNDAWNSPDSVPSGQGCCPDRYTAVGDPTCLAYDGWRELQGLHPYPVINCAEALPFFCEVPTVANNGGQRVLLSAAAPHLLYTPQPPVTAQVFNRELNAPEDRECTPSLVFDSGKRQLVQRQLGKALQYIATTLSPKFPSTRISGNSPRGEAFTCTHEYFSWGLAREMAFDEALTQYHFSNLDLVVLLTGSPDRDTVFSIPCGYHTDGRPSVVVLNVNPLHLDAVGVVPKGEAKLYSRLLQGLLRGLGFHEALFESWKQPVVTGLAQSHACSGDDTRLTPECRNLALIQTPAVTAFVNTEQFRCTGHPDGGAGALGGAELDDLNLYTMPPAVFNAYWEKRLFKGEVMTRLPPLTEDLGSHLPVVSGLTLAAFVDMGWYNVQTAAAERLPWGYKRRCAFASTECGGDGTARVDRYTCSDVPAVTCAPDFLSLAHCTKVSPGGVPERFSDRGGTDPLMDYCMFKQTPNSQAFSCLVPDAVSTACETGACAEFQLKGRGSRCFETTLKHGRHRTAAPTLGAAETYRGTCLPHRCVADSAGNYKLEIPIAGEVYTCEAANEVVGPSIRAPAGSDLEGRILCPDPEEFCEEAGTHMVEDRCSAVDDCHAHGTCTAAGQCACYDSADIGRFDGERCDRCKAGYYPYPLCTSLACPRDDAGIMCHANGECDGLTGVCTCHADAARGFWDPATACSTCAAGYSGAMCTVRDCVGDAECGHGVCSPVGRCACFFDAVTGYWAGRACNRCRDGYDSATGCTRRFSNYFVCDSIAAADGLARVPDPIDCTTCAATCASEGVGAGLCSTPATFPLHDQFGCLMSPAAPACVAPETPSCRGACPTPSVTLIDCHGYPLLYETCGKADQCGCLPAARMACLAGTDAAPPLGYAPQIKDGATTAAPYAAAAGKRCQCHDLDAVEVDCFGPTDAASGLPTYEWGSVVYFDPARTQEVFEDFCHCTSPPLPTCSQHTKPYILPERTYATPLDCTAMRRRSGCPDWARILNIGQVARPNDPDLSVVDCGGWPPPVYAARDPCGCAFPAFTCKPGTEGVCDAGACPDWGGPVTVDCDGAQPPIVTAARPHPCGCDPPPKPVCAEGTEACCTCDFPAPPTVWVDCRLGGAMEVQAWDMEAVFPEGNPWLQPCNPCPGCVPPPPVRRCIPGYGIRPASDNPMTPCSFDPNRVLDLARCEAHPPSCPVDCHGAPMPAPQYDDECSCPAPPPPACLPGTSGPGGVRETEVHTAPCAANPEMCGAYACAPDGDLTELAMALGVTASPRACGVREEVWEGSPREKRCRQACGTDLDCACGFKCGVCGRCVSVLTPDPPRHGNCLLDHGRSCGAYECELSCIHDSARIAATGATFAKCKTACASAWDCADGFACDLPAYAPPPRASAALHGDADAMNGAAGRSSERSTAPDVGYAAGLPGFAPFNAVGRSDPHREGTGRTAGVMGAAAPPLERALGECLQSPEGASARAVLHCFSHDECGGYACGTDRRQVFFSASRCRSSCWVDAHCHPDYECSRAAARCVRVARSHPAASACEDRDDLLGSVGGCFGVLNETEGVDCDSDLSRDYGFSMGTTLRMLCPTACGVCAAGSASVHEAALDRAAGVLQDAGTCEDDPERKLLVFGDTPAIRCAAVIEAVPCGDVLGELVLGLQAGVLTEEVCPLSCGKCAAPPTPSPYSPGGPDTWEDACRDYTARSGATDEARCRSQVGCCFNPSTSRCFTCLSGFERATDVRETLEEAAGGVAGASPYCEDQPMDFCAPYTCGGGRGVLPKRASVCGTTCHGDADCQPFHQCVFPTLAELTKAHAATAAASRFELMRMESAVGGRCKPAATSAAGLGSASPEADYALDGGWLSVPLGALKGYQADPAVARGAVPAFPPPLLPDTTGKMLWEGVVADATECHPYLAGSSEPLAQGQLRQMILDAEAAASSATPPPEAASTVETPGPDDGTSATPPPATPTDGDDGGSAPTLDINSPALPACERSCRTDAQCAGGYYCVEAASEKHTLPKHTCQPVRGLGTLCEADRECGTGYCVGGVCCNARCDLPCQTCSDMGVCGWGLPFTNPLRRCVACEYCDYVADPRGEITAASPLGCVKVPLGLDPSRDCAEAGACNGEGGCLIPSARYGGARGRDCAPGFTGADCKEPAVAYRPVPEPAVDTDTCSVTELVSMSGSPEAGMSTTAHKEILRRSAATGFTVASATHPQERVVNRVDKRPRQWAAKVLGVSHHGSNGCSKILGPPSYSAVDAPLHRTSDESYAPRQYYIAEGGRAVHPELLWNPLVSCEHSLEVVCAAAEGCAWHAGEKVCANVEAYTPVHVAEARCMKQFYCYDHNRTTPECQSLYPRCKILVPLDDSTIGVEETSMTKPVLEWIELEFDDAVDIESVILHENHGAGSLVKIEVQAMMNGSVLLQQGGGAAPRTHPVTGALEKPLSRDDLEYVPTQAEICAGFSEYGVSVCVRQLGCDWNYNLRRCVLGTQCSTTREICNRLEFRGECFWNPTEQRCMDGSACHPASNAETLERQMKPYCPRNKTNKEECTTGEHGLYCDWQPETKAVCVPWRETNECAKYTTNATCESQMRGTANSLVQFCQWNHVTLECFERPELFSCEMNLQGLVRGEYECGTVLGCLWDADAKLCGKNTTGTADEHDCGTWESHDKCVSCPYNGAAHGCNSQCTWEVQERESCQVRQAGFCSALGTAECERLPICSWLGRDEEVLKDVFNEVVLKAARQSVSGRAPRRTAEQLEAAEAEAEDDASVAVDFTGTGAQPAVATRGAATLAQTPNHVPGGFTLPSTCYLNQDTAESLRREALKGSQTVSSVELTGYCNSQFTGKDCVKGKDRAIYMNDLDLPACQWVTEVASDSPELVIPLPPVSLTEVAMMGDAANHPPAPFRRKHMGQESIQLIKKQVKSAPVTETCETLKEGTSLNFNVNPWQVVWERGLPQFPLRKRYREAHIDVGSIGARSKNVRLWFAPTSPLLSQIDAVAIVGRQSPTAACEGYIWASSIPDGLPENATIDTASPWAVPCNGRGRCGPRGCECEGNWYGSGCDRCKLGWGGATCEDKLDVGCRQVAWDNPQNYTSSEAVRRFKFADFEVERSKVIEAHHFGTELFTPAYVLGAGHSHVKLSFGVVLLDVDNPDNGGDDCGVYIRIYSTTAPGPRAMKVIYSRPCSFYTGVNVLGQENTEVMDFFSTTVAWPHSRVIIAAHTWGGLSIAAPKIALNHIELSACKYPDHK
eukprot:TRINITY_DN17913_c0_g1_i1.p1 TRINITY_DN17913_c0_g1~~TRINITY_DN17913_c0_g1_i1.p1  ORF type:complete len:3388 (+),score=1005.66 TRINITY_DN17913_c0_g1_i1:101-10264(+)